jgi:hypothetical protein
MLRKIFSLLIPGTQVRYPEVFLIGSPYPADPADFAQGLSGHFFLKSDQH